MDTIAPFGFVTGCHPGDKFMVQATLASMRNYCPDVPICLVVDGFADVRDLEKQYRLQVLRTADLPTPEMREMCFGSPRAKLAAMWEGPFEHYVWLDSDAIVWGDFTAQVRRDVDFQIFWSEVSVLRDAQEVPSWLRHYYFDPEKLHQLDADFEWRGLAYFSNGAFATRRNALPFERWQECLAWRKLSRSPWPRSFFDMPMMNYLVHSMEQKGDLKVAMTDLQQIWLHHGCDEIEIDCAGAGWRFPASIRRPRVLHFCGEKPYLYNRRGYSHPFTIARLEHHRRKHSEVGVWLELLKEEAVIVANKVRRKLGAPLRERLVASRE